MSTEYQIVVCGSLVPDPLQTLEPIQGPTGPALKNEMMLLHSGKRYVVFSENANVGVCRAFGMNVVS